MKVWMLLIILDWQTTAVKDMAFDTEAECIAAKAVVLKHHRDKVNSRGLTIVASCIPGVII